jgi:ABC-type sugar transport system substrate-binding protein
MEKTPLNRRDRRRAGVVVAWLLALVMTACGAGEADEAAEGSDSSLSGSSVPSGSTGSSSAGVDAAAALVEEYSAPLTDFPDVEPVEGAADLAGKSVWYVPIGMGPPAFQVYADSLTEALSHLDIDVHVCDGKFVPTAITACLEQAGSSGADAVVTGIVAYVLVSQAVDDLVKKGVKVMIGGDEAPEGVSNTDMLAFRGTLDSQLLQQELTASTMIVDSGGTANILYIGNSEIPSLQLSADHAVDFIGENCPACKVTRIEYTTTGLDKLPSAVSAALIKEPDTDYIFAELDTAVPAAIAGARSAGFEDKVKIGGVGGDLAVLQGIEGDGPVLATTGSLLSFASWLFADDVVRMLAGQVPVDEGFTVPSRLFTKANVSDLSLTPEGYASMEWYGSDAYKDKFLAAWGAE